MLSQYAQGDASLSACSERSVCGAFECWCEVAAVEVSAVVLYAERRFGRVGTQLWLWQQVR